VPQEEVDPAVIGQWSGPWNYSSTAWGGVSPHGNELAHGDLVVKGPYQGGVLVWRATTAAVDPVWWIHPRNPQNLYQVPNPNIGSFPPACANFAANNIFCSAHAKDENGNLVIAGGSLSHAGFPGTSTSFLLNPDGMTWTFLGCMNHPRWYPTTVRLGTNVFVAIGGWKDGTSLGTSWDDPNNTVWDDFEKLDMTLVSPGWVVADPIEPTPSGTLFVDNCGLVPLPPPNPPGSTYHFLGAPFWLYPRVHLLTSGDLYTSGELLCNILIDPTDLTSAAYTEKTPLSLPSGIHVRDHGCAFRMPGFVSPAPGNEDNIVILGGSPTFDPGASALDLIRVNPDPKTIDSWNFVNNDAAFKLPLGRVYANTVILPDGSIFIVGGSWRKYDDGQPWWSGIPCDPDAPPMTPCTVYGPDKYPKPILTPLLLERNAAGIWQFRNLAEHGFARLYHSVAVLLPTGQVLSVGGQQVLWSALLPGDPTLAGITNADAAIYNPPYLFKGPRPMITSAPTGPLHYPPTTLSFDVQYQLGSPTDPIAKVVLIRPGSVTHHFDFEQKYVELTSNPHPTLPNTLQVTPPPNNDVAPTGYWMLFLVSQTGIPSEAKFVQFLL
jgi:hypothetical protein